MARGGARPGERRGGRQKGSRNKAKTFREELRAYCDAIGADPFRYMADLLVTNASHVLRLRAAVELAQYLEPKLRAIEHTAAGGQPLVILHKWAPPETIRNGGTAVPVRALAPPAEDL